MSNRFIESATSRGLKKETGFREEDLKRFVRTVSVLLIQGERLKNVGTETQMILFEGRPGNDAVSIQAQGGEDLRQLIVAAVKGDMIYQFYLNWQPEDRSVFPHAPPQVERFTKGPISPDAKRRLYARPEGGWPKPPEPADSNDLRLLTELLENTTVAPEILKRVVDDIVAQGSYRRISDFRLEEKGFGRLIGRLRFFPTRNKP